MLGAVRTVMPRLLRGTCSGIHRRTTPSERPLYNHRLTSTSNLLPRDARVMRAWARLMVGRQNEVFEDGMIAAVAVVHRLTVVTRNVKHVQPFAVPTLNPFG